MTQIRVMTQNGYTLVYDTDDVEDITVRTQHAFSESDGPNGTIRRELTGFTSLDVHIDFKHGKRALWVKNKELDGDRIARELTTATDILTEALHAENVEPELASRILNRFLFGDPRGLDAGPLPIEQEPCDTHGWADCKVCADREREGQWPDGHRKHPADGGRPLKHDPDHAMGERP